MRSSTRTNRLLAAAAPVGAGLITVGTAIVIAGAGWGVAPILVGILILVAGIAGVHGLLGHRYGGLGFLGFLFTQSALVAIFLPLAGIGFLLLIPAAVMLGAALLRMEPPLRGAALALASVWPASLLLDGTTELTFAEALALVFPLPYAWLALDARRIPAPAAK